MDGTLFNTPSGMYSIVLYTYKITLTNKDKIIQAFYRIIRDLVPPLPDHLPVEPDHVP